MTRGKLHGVALEHRSELQIISKHVPPVLRPLFTSVTGREEKLSSYRGNIWVKHSHACAQRQRQGEDGPTLRRACRGQSCTLGRRKVYMCTDDVCHVVLAAVCVASGEHASRLGVSLVCRVYRSVLASQRSHYPGFVYSSSRRS